MRRLVCLSVMAIVVVLPLAPSESSGKGGACPSGMAQVAVDGISAYCIDRWEASLIELQGKIQAAHKPTLPVGKVDAMAVTHSGVVPQGYISKVEAEAACKRSKKRLCTGAEWERACRGKTPTLYPYGDEQRPGYCNDSGKAPLASLHPDLGENVYASAEAMNDHRINEAPGTVAATGSYPHCRNGFGVYDMVGNLHEWVADVHDGTRGTFRGGYYQDTHINGDGCTYKTSAHDVSYHDYSTGFRCCADSK